MTTHPGPVQARRMCSYQRYEIVIRGRLSSRYQSAFDDVTVVSYAGQTTLRADVLDQSRLYGLLNRLRDLGIELIRVDRISEATMAADQVLAGRGRFQSRSRCGGGASRRRRARFRELFRTPLSDDEAGRPRLCPLGCGGRRGGARHVVGRRHRHRPVRRAIRAEHLDPLDTDQPGQVPRGARATFDAAVLHLRSRRSGGRSGPVPGR